MRNLFGQDIPATDPGTATDTSTARKKEAKQPDPNGLRKVGCNRTKGAYFARRVKSELNLEESIDAVYQVIREKLGEEEA